MPRHPQPPPSEDRAHVPGERIPAWLAVALAILGTTASVQVAQWVIPGDMEIRLAFRGLDEAATSGFQGAHTPSTAAVLPMSEPRMPVDEAPEARTLRAPVAEPRPALAGVAAPPTAESVPATPTMEQLPAPVLVVTDSETSAARPLADAALDADAEVEPQPALGESGLAEPQTLAGSPVAASVSEADSGKPAEDAAAGLATPAAVQPGWSRTRVCAPMMEIDFASGSARPRTVGLEPTLVQLRAAVEAHPQLRLLVEGHADAVGPEEYNLVLSYRRAVAVANLLTAAGIPAERLVTRAYGEETGGALGDGQHNRRVIVRTEGLDGCLSASHYAEMN